MMWRRQLFVFLYQYAGKKATEICGKDKRGKEITIKLACYREVDRFIDSLSNPPTDAAQSTT